MAFVVAVRRFLFVLKAPLPELPATWHTHRSAGFSPLQCDSEKEDSEYFKAFFDSNAEAA
jgi:hypothetical protein